MRVCVCMGVGECDAFPKRASKHTHKKKLRVLDFLNFVEEHREREYERTREAQVMEVRE